MQSANSRAPYLRRNYDVWDPTIDVDNGVRVPGDSPSNPLYTKSVRKDFKDIGLEIAIAIAVALIVTVVARIAMNALWPKKK